MHVPTAQHVPTGPTAQQQPSTAISGDNTAESSVPQDECEWTFDAKGPDVTVTLEKVGARTYV